MDFGYIDEDSMKLCIAEMYDNFETRQQKIIQQQVLKKDFLSMEENHNLLTTATSQSFLTQKSVSAKSCAPEVLTSGNADLACTLDLSSLTEDKVELDGVLVVKQTYPIREVWIQKRKAWIPTAMIVVCDASANEKELIMWGKQCKNILLLTTGTILYARNLIVKKFRENCVLNMTKNSVCSVIGSFDDVPNETKLDDSLQAFVNRIEALKTHFSWYKQKNVAYKPRAIRFCVYNELKPGSLTHTQAGIVSISSSSKSTTDHNPMRITVSLPENTQPCALFLHGSAQIWRKKLVLLRKYMWEFFYLACSCSNDGDTIELHTTIISTAKPIFDDISDTKTSNISITSVKQFDNLTKFKELHCEVQLCGIVTKSVICQLGSRQLLLTNETPIHLIERVINKCFKVGHNDDTFTTQSFFENGESATPINLIIPTNEIGVLTMQVKKLLFQKNSIEVKLEDTVVIFTGFVSDETSKN
uniref:shieldin complex subunit 2-like n=1 Tax=Styela clava TaxID=7725 RepID=UPI00193A7F62|nr:shieldin complex subunit 2-like [Styela clava]